MNKNKELNFNKLVRNNIPDIIEKEGYFCDYEKVTNRETIKTLLFEKLAEEVEELKKDNCAEEFADVLEVLDEIKNFLEIKDIENTKEKKKEKKGSFSEHIFFKKAYKKLYS